MLKFDEHQGNIFQAEYSVEIMLGLVQKNVQTGILKII